MARAVTRGRASAAAAEDRRTRVLEVAQRLVAEGGLGALTHRAVEGAAGVPHGTVTYWFGSRDGLVDALVDDMSAHCAAQARPIADGLAAQAAAGVAPDPAQVATAMAGWMDGSRELHLARLELELAGARDPRLSERMAHTAAVFWAMCEPLVAAAGSPDPPRDARVMASMIDGLLLDRLARPDGGADALASAMRHLLATWAPA